VPGCEGRGREIFRGYVAKVTGELHGLLAAGLGAGLGAGDTVAVFGHAVFLNAVAIAVAEAMSIDKAEELVAAMELGEAMDLVLRADGLADLQRGELENDPIPKEDGNEERGEGGSGGPEGLVLKDVEEVEKLRLVFQKVEVIQHGGSVRQRRR
jgi:hypothetical protein